jgi:hypothetical protein
MRGFRSALAGVCLGLFALPAAAAAPTADLAVNVHPDERHQVRIGQQVRIHVTVANNGPDAVPVRVSTLTPDTTVVTAVDCGGGGVIDGTDCLYPLVPSGRRVHAELTAGIFDWPLPALAQVTVEAQPATDVGVPISGMDPLQANNRASWSATITR